jgi:hypothetical protein
MSDIKFTDQELLNEILNGYTDMHDEDAAPHIQCAIELHNRLTAANARLEEAYEMIVMHRRVNDRILCIAMVAKSVKWLESYQSQKGGKG